MANLKELKQNAIIAESNLLEAGTSKNIVAYLVPISINMKQVIGTKISKQIMQIKL